MGDRHRTDPRARRYRGDSRPYRNWLRSALGKRGEAIRLLYGGSVKPPNAGDLLAIPDVDGVLVGERACAPPASWPSPATAELLSPQSFS